ncbi:aBC transporter related protein [Firmicutes bacterium CAG:884]|nr:aBC transporter related protein [Firmicutes bacterium CAG:884]
MEILKIKNLNKSFGKKKILKNVSFNVNEGDILGFIGPNGAGKTTTIKMILGLQSINSGTVTINGYDIKKNFEKAIEKVGTIVENPDLYMYLSGYDNLKLISNLYKNVDKKRIDEVIKIVKLETRINDKVSKYSLGMRQRLGIAQALLHKPNLLILDEPTNGLDPEGIKELRDIIKRLATKEKVGVVISSHNLSELESFCNKIVIIKNGEIVETNELKKVKNIEESYIFEVDEISKISKILEEKIEKINDNSFKIHINKESIPEIIKKLIENGVKIYTVKEEEISLEDAFLKRTGGNIID